MAKEISKQGLSVFEQIKHTDESGIEFWSASELAKALDYSEYRHFLPVIEKAKEACKNSGQLTENHFVDFHEMVRIGSGTQRKMENCSAFIHFDNKRIL